VGLKQEGDFISGNTDFSFESEEVTGSLFKRKKWNRPLIMLIKFIKKYIVSPIKSGMVIVDQQRAHQRVLYEQF
jgi:DNA mismatch repair protein MutL